MLLKKIKKNWKPALIVSVISFAGIAWAGLEILYTVTLDFPLYKNEHYWGGSKAAELSAFIDGGLRVQRAQRKIVEATDFQDKPEGPFPYAKRAHSIPQRVFHAKSHGCVTGKLVLIEERPGDPHRSTFQGLFDPSRRKSYDVLVRFSNGVGFDRPDKLPDVRGAAIKIFDVYNSATGKSQTVDFLMTNSPTPFGKDFLEFADFMDQVADHGPTVGGALFSAAHLRAGKSLLKATGLPVVSDNSIKSVATERYWSGHPYLLGPDIAMKFNIIPTAPSGRRFTGENYLREELRYRLANGDVKFIFAVQLEKNPTDTPIEDNLKVWDERISPSISVAELVLDQQRVGDRGYELCENYRFTPAHYIPEHRPLSNMGRGRLFGYEASQIGRGASREEPTAELIPWLREVHAVRRIQ